MQQHTIAQPIIFNGIGVHSGSPVKLSILPAKENSGIVFIRTDLNENNVVNANVRCVVDARLCTIISNDHGVKVSTIEHLMAALWSCNIDNAIIEVSAQEIPIMDGSSDLFIKKITQAGITEQNAPKTFLKILKPIKLEVDDKYIELLPSDEFEVQYEIEFNHHTIGAQSFTFKNNEMDFSQTIGQARTFGFIKEVEMLKNMGLAKGASLENAIGVDENGIMNPEGLRYENEFVRHKILDCIGDLYLAGNAIIAKVNARKASHQIHCAIVSKIFENPENYTYVTKEFTSLQREASFLEGFKSDSKRIVQ